MSHKAVEIGYLEAAASSRHLLSPFFPSKFGGRPAWLSLNNIPSLQRLGCAQCGQAMVFLLQVYAPSDDSDATFHRTIFLFLCRSSACWGPNVSSGIVRVFRSQLARRNDFYSYDPVDPNTPDGHDAVARLSAVFDRLCALCGISASQRCGKCKRVNYCCREHQTLHWSAGHNRTCCAQNDDDGRDEVDCPLLFAEFEITTVLERTAAIDDAPERSSEQRMAEYRRYVADSAVRSKHAKQSYPLEELESMSKEVDKDFKRFRRRIECNPHQVIRYQLNGEPLLAGRPPVTEIPACHRCGSSRTFEFQIMPHLLSYMSVDEVSSNGIDWATLCVYTCSANCESVEEDYCEEYAYKQDYNQ